MKLITTFSVNVPSYGETFSFMPHITYLSSGNGAQLEALNGNNGAVCRYADGGICDG
jgi:hypothetical protein